MRREAEELEELIGQDALVALAEEFGGERLYVPLHITADHRIAQVIGLLKAVELSTRYSPDCIRIPLLRDLRAVRYRAAGLGQAAIARRLGMTENGVWKLFARTDRGGTASGS